MFFHTVLCNCTLEIYRSLRNSQVFLKPNELSVSRMEFTYARFYPEFSVFLKIYSLTKKYAQIDTCPTGFFLIA